MPAIKLSAVGFIAAGLAASFAVPSDSWAVGLSIGHESATVQTPTSGPSGINYQQTGSQAGALTVYTTGFLFCDNVYQGSNEEITFTSVHEDQTFSPAHRWAFNPGTDLVSVLFNGGNVVVNRPDADGSPVSTLSCHSVGPTGEINALTQGIFDNGLESARATNYSDMFNWNPPEGYDWNAPDWSQVPVDPCNPSVDKPAHVVEDVACTAVSAVRPSGAAGGQRAPTIWTASDGVTFTYLFRVDDRIGPQTPGEPPQFSVPATSNTDTIEGTPTVAAISIIDAYDASYLGPTGQYCFLTDLPTVLNSSVCSGQTTYAIKNGNLRQQVFAQPPPLGTSSYSFYIAVIRQIGQGSHTNLGTPVVGVAAVMDTALIAEGGDKFSGDDVLFGFMPTSAGFPWMGGQ